MSDQPIILTLTVSIEEANLILSGLGELPAKLVVSLIDKIKSQAVAQISPPADPEEPCSAGE